MKKLILVFSIVLINNVYSEQNEDDHHNDEKEHSHEEHSENSEKVEHDEHDSHDKESSFGKGKAILAIKNDGELFQLSSESEIFLNVQTKSIIRISANMIRIERDHIVEFKNELGVFLKRENWFKLVQIQIVSENKLVVVAKVNDLMPADLLVTKPLGTLRAAHLQATGEGGKGHAH